jgi:hypothetical protein
MAWDPKDENAPLINKILTLKVERGMNAIDISQALEITHQTVYEAINSDLFIHMEAEYWKALEEHLAESQRRGILKAKAILIDAAPDAAERLVLYAKDDSPNVRTSAVKASERVLMNVGVGVSEGLDLTGDRIALRIIVERAAIDEATDLGVDIITDTTIEHTPSAIKNKGAQLGTELAERDAGYHPIN